MKVQVVSEGGEVIWSYEAGSEIDNSGNAWRNNNHPIMAGVVYLLNKATEQALEFPPEKDWMYPFSVNSSSKNSIQKVGKRIALEGPLSKEFEFCAECCSHHCNADPLSVDGFSFVIFQPHSPERKR